MLHDKGYWWSHVWVMGSGRAFVELLLAPASKVLNNWFEVLLTMICSWRRQWCMDFQARIKYLNVPIERETVLALWIVFMSVQGLWKQKAPQELLVPVGLYSLQWTIHEYHGMISSHIMQLLRYEGVLAPYYTTKHHDFKILDTLERPFFSMLVFYFLEKLTK